MTRDFDIKADVDGHTLEEFQKLIQQRMTLLNETAEKSIVACAIQVLKSLRAATKLAKRAKPLEFTSVPGLYYGMKQEGKGKVKPKPCLRFTGSNAEYKLQKGEVFIIPQKGIHAKQTQIYLWVKGNGVKIYLAATSQSVAKKYMTEREKRRIAKHKGLAKRALGLLAHKVSASINVSDNVQAAAQVIAQQNTRVEKSIGSRLSGDFSITVEDDLNYATDALKHGEGDIQSSMQKALNSIAAVINKRCEKILGFEKIEIPFPKD